ncbi:hypothetical protein A2886_03150 [candidate division WWE3 bacterium RIFCSPHIGHO2_01_FULL_42_13]|uniref:Uncharacterized protein n=1 Tax=candidate division WWE3 bacterium RIFCSPHIGHO2_01_FULL_42_13 TaxID=1802617 RepID=A0A1F4UR76_UNCKA|nr:MAG: hypothetical protein A2886_03150 [candidate division WWE3 bacterium RIFCSPHIGHO2_01_FULL_42_13]
MANLYPATIDQILLIDGEKWRFFSKDEVRKYNLCFDEVSCMFESTKILLVNLNTSRPKEFDPSTVKSAVMEW